MFNDQVRHGQLCDLCIGIVKWSGGKLVNYTRKMWNSQIPSFQLQHYMLLQGKPVNTLVVACASSISTMPALCHVSVFTLLWIRDATIRVNTILRIAL